MDIPLKDILTALGTVAAALIAAFVGSLQGAKTALARFKRERGFERRLGCYEEIAKQFGKAKLELEVAKTFQEDPDEPHEQRCHMWKRVQAEYIALAALEPVAAIYAGEPVYTNLVHVREAFDEVANETNGMDVEALCAKPELASPLIDVLYDALQTHAIEVRRELGFEARRVWRRVSAQRLVQTRTMERCRCGSRVSLRSATSFNVTDGSHDPTPADCP